MAQYATILHNTNLYLLCRHFGSHIKALTIQLKLYCKTFYQTEQDNLYIHMMVSINWAPFHTFLTSVHHICGILHTIICKKRSSCTYLTFRNFIQENGLFHNTNLRTKFYKRYGTNWLKPDWSRLNPISTMYTSYWIFFVLKLSFYDWHYYEYSTNIEIDRKWKNGVD